MYNHEAKGQYATMWLYYLASSLIETFSHKIAEMAVHYNGLNWEREQKVDKKSVE